MSNEVEELEKAISSKNEDEITKITLNHTNAQRVKLREDYQAKYSRDLIKDLESNFSKEFKDCLVGLYKSPAEFDADLLYNAMKGAGSDKEVMTEVVCFRSPEEFEAIKAKFQEKYGKDLISEIKDECSGDYRKIILALLDNKRVPNSNPDLENCTKIAKELYDAGEGKIGDRDRKSVV